VKPNNSSNWKTRPQENNRMPARIVPISTHSAGFIWFFFANCDNRRHTRSVRRRPTCGAPTSGAPFCWFVSTGTSQFAPFSSSSRTNERTRLGRVLPVRKKTTKEISVWGWMTHPSLTPTHTPTRFHPWTRCVILLIMLFRLCHF